MSSSGAVQNLESRTSSVWLGYTKAGGGFFWCACTCQLSLLHAPIEQNQIRTAARMQVDVLMGFEVYSRHA
jgi:hypothetical protein